MTLGVNRGSLHTEAAGAAHADADMKEVLAQRCHELDTQVCMLFYRTYNKCDFYVKF